jgi:DNA-binding MarR family transcriptional regulator
MPARTESDADPGPPLAADAGTLLTRDFIAAVVIFHELVGRRLGVSPTDRKCLDLISRGAVTAGELGRFTGLTSGAVTGIIDRLVAAGYAQRVTDPNDRRRVLVSRKPGTKLDQVLPAIFGPLGDDMAKVASRYTSEQLALIADFLARTREVLVENTQRLERQQVGE